MKKWRRKALVWIVMVAMLINNFSGLGGFRAIAADRPGDGVKLNELAMITAVGSNENVFDNIDPSKGATWKFDLSFQIGGYGYYNVLQRAKDAGYWTYDLRDAIPEPFVLDDFEQEPTTLYDGVNPCGYFRIVDGIVYLYPSEAALQSWNYMITGSFNVAIGLDAEKIGYKDKASFELPWSKYANGSDVKCEVTFTEAVVTPGKGVGTSANGGYGESGKTVAAVANSDGSYTLYYQVTANTTRDIKGLTLSDTFSQGQTVDLSSVKVNGQSANGTVNGNSLTVNLGDVKAGTHTVTYAVNVSADAAKNAVSNSAVWNWNGDKRTQPVSTNISFKEPAVTSNTKKISTNAYWMDQNPSVIQINEKEDSVEVYYEVSVTTDGALNSLILQDTLSAGQTLGTIHKGGIGGEVIQPTTNYGGSFTVDLGAVSAGTHTLTYSVIVSKGVESIQNTSMWKWNGKYTPTADTNVRVEVVKTPDPSSEPDEPGYEGPGIDKSSAGFNNGVNQYTIVIGAEGTDCAGYTVTDKISDYVKISSIVITGSENFYQELTPNSALQDMDPSGATIEVFSYTFPSDQEYMGPYTVTYTAEALSYNANNAGVKDVYNTASISKDGKGTEDKTDDKVNLGPHGSITKDWVSFDKNEKTVTWKVLVSVPEGEKLNNVVVKDAECNYSDNEYYQGNAMTILWDKVSVKAADGSDYTAFTTDSQNKTVTFAQLDQDVTITFVSTAENAFTLSTLWVYNKAELSVDGHFVGSDDAVKQYEDFSGDDDGEVQFDFSKTLVSEKDGVYTWQVVINSTHRELNPDVTELAFKDTLPEGMEYIPDTFYNLFQYGQLWREGTPVDSQQSVEYNAQTHTLTKKNVLNYDDWNNTTLSGQTITIKYQTRITEEALKEDFISKDFTNKAEVNSENPKAHKEASDKVTVTYDALSKAEAGFHNDELKYVIKVNEQAKTLNAGENVLLEDQIPNNVILVPSSVVVEGADPDSVVIGYNGDDRILSIELPDRTACTIQYTVLVRTPIGETATIVNVAKLKGIKEYEKVVQEEHKVQRRSGTISGQSNAIYFSKIDRTNISKNLEDAEFKVYTVEIDSEYKIIPNSDKLEFTVKSNKKGLATVAPLGYERIYYWVETEAPFGYTIDSAEPHYFSVYDEKDDALKARVLELVERVSEANDIMVRSMFDGETTLVSDTSISKDISINKMVVTENGLDELADAKLYLYKGEKALMDIPKEGDLISEWTSVVGENWDVQVEAGTYTIEEAFAPAGFEKITKNIVFTVDDDGIVTVKAESVQAGDAEVNNEGVLLVKNTIEKIHTIKVNKVDITNDEELDGAVIVIKDASGETVGEWKSEKGKEGEIELTAGTYTLEETTAPEGFDKITTEVEFTVDKDGKVTVTTETKEVEVKDGVILVKDAPTKHVIKINKVDITNDEELDGAVIVIKDASGETVGEWKSEKGKEGEIELTAGTYTLEETTAPEGFDKITTEVEFTVDKDGKVTVTTETKEVEVKDGVILVKDAPTKHVVKVNKVDITNDEELDGAVIVIKDASGETVGEWKSEKGKEGEIELTAGTYTLEETTAPEGFDEITTEVEFTVDKDGNVTVATDTEEVEVKDGVILVKDAPKREESSEESSDESSEESSDESSEESSDESSEESSDESSEESSDESSEESSDESSEESSEEDDSSKDDSSDMSGDESSEESSDESSEESSEEESSKPENSSVPSNNPDTGDGTNLPLMAAMMGISSLGAAALIIKMRKKEESEE